MAKRHNQKLDFKKAREIRRRREEESLKLRELASRYGVRAPTVSGIIRGETWREPKAVPDRGPRPPTSEGQILGDDASFLQRTA